MAEAVDAAEGEPKPIVEGIPEPEIPSVVVLAPAMQARP